MLALTIQCERRKLKESDFIDSLLVFQNIMTDVKTQIFTREQLIQETKTTYEQTKKEYSKLTQDNKSLYKLSNSEKWSFIN